VDELASGRGVDRARSQPGLPSAARRPRS